VEEENTRSCDRLKEKINEMVREGFWYDFAVDLEDGVDVCLGF
jgi:hypothetical protein